MRVARRGSWIAWIALGALSVGASARAGSPPAPGFNEVCGPVLKAPPTDQRYPTSKREYCQAAEASRKASGNSKRLGTVWAAVAAVCTASCALPVSQNVCTGAQVGGAAAEALMSSDLGQALMAAGQTLGTSLVASQVSGGARKQAQDQAQDQARDQGKSNKLGACLAALTAAGTSVQRFQNAAASRTAFNENFANAAGNESNTESLGQDGGPDGARDGGHAGGRGAGLGTGGEATAEQVLSENAAQSADCSGSRGGVDGILACAVANDSALPSFVTDPAFKEQFQEKTGLELGDFLARDTSQGSAIDTLGAAMGSGLDAAAEQAVTAGVKDLASKLRSAPAEGGALYASARGSGSSGASAAETMDFNGLMQGMMGQLFPKGEEKQAAGAREIGFGEIQNRSPASLVEDRTLSLFDRVAFRYQTIAKDPGALGKLEWTTPMNRALSGRPAAK